jgi:DNA-binding Lrp family transcriptional regulator
MVTAIVLINVKQGGVPEVAERLLALEGIAEVYSVAGPYDIVAIARVRHHDDLADLVAAHVQAVEGITATNTLIAFQAYARRDLEAMWQIGFDEPA